uniref:Uncharacterized protein n=1 Tax=Oryza punctata TaxID=4537 RepID=A0A0E0JJU3_ORYPU
MPSEWRRSSAAANTRRPWVRAAPPRTRDTVPHVASAPRGEPATVAGSLRSPASAPAIRRGAAAKPATGRQRREPGRPWRAAQQAVVVRRCHLRPSPFDSGLPLQRSVSCSPTAHRYHRSCRWLRPRALLNPARVSPALLGTKGAATALVTMECTVVVLKACVHAYFVTANQSLKVFPNS